MLKRSDMSSVDMKVLRFADAKETRFQTVKRSNMCTTVLQCGRISTSHESRFQGAKH